MLEVRHLNKTYRSGFFGKRKAEAVRDVSFRIEDGEIFGLIGESGSGKTTITRMIAGLLKPTSGSIIYEGQDLVRANARAWHGLRREIQVVFQHPQMTFHPRKDIYFACAEPIRLYHLDRHKSEKEMIGHMMGRVGIPEDQLREAAKSAVCKINIDSDGRLAMTAAVREIFATKPAEFDPRKYLGPARDSLRELYKHKLTDVLGSANTVK